MDIIQWFLSLTQSKQILYLTAFFIGVWLYFVLFNKQPVVKQ